MRPAIIIVDMVKDSFREEHHLPITQEAQPIIPRINHLVQRGRQLGIPIIFACDSFLPNDIMYIKTHFTEYNGGPKNQIRISMATRKTAIF